MAPWGISDRKNLGSGVREGRCKEHASLAKVKPDSLKWSLVWLEEEVAIPHVSGAMGERKERHTEEHRASLTSGLAGKSWRFHCHFWQL